METAMREVAETLSLFGAGVNQCCALRDGGGPSSNGLRALGSCHCVEPQFGDGCGEITKVKLSIHSFVTRSLIRFEGMSLGSNMPSRGGFASFLGRRYYRNTRDASFAMPARSRGDHSVGDTGSWSACRAIVAVGSCGSHFFAAGVAQERDQPPYSARVRRGDSRGDFQITGQHG